MSTAHAANPSQKPAHPCAGTQFAPVMMMAGGTGGHIFPALAVAKVLRARGVPVVWLGAEGAMETRLVPQHGIELDTLAITGLRGKGKLALLGAPVRVLRAIRAAGFVLRRRAPRAVGAGAPIGSAPLTSQPPMPADATVRGTSRLRQRVEPNMGTNPESAALSALRRSR